jgi:hypothetical protein
VVLAEREVKKFIKVELWPRIPRRQVAEVEVDLEWIED